MGLRWRYWRGETPEALRARVSPCPLIEAPFHWPYWPSAAARRVKTRLILSMDAEVAVIRTNACCATPSSRLSRPPRRHASAAAESCPSAFHELAAATASRGKRNPRATSASACIAAAAISGLADRRQRLSRAHPTLLRSCWQA
ncbi:hypothetical protein DSL92_01700 [Billgrantia gudaonensis]|uniref:Uncharacterized protein n=1 Tax=Billgrantia gudaonensis TaxID=376427 RepID=A0A3S0Q1J6_9GAMM|nr:hypothetical protein DSL92_01700 [Halomonas gudaonensis]